MVEQRITGKTHSTDTALYSQSGRPKIAIMFSMFLPYHVARVNAVAIDYEIIGIEGAPYSDTYAWAKFVDADKMHRVTLFTDAPISRKSTKEIRDVVTAALSEHQPDVVLVPGWYSSWQFAMLAWSLDNRVPAIILSESQAIDHERVWYREWIKQRILRSFSAAIVAGRRHVAYAAQLGMPEDRIFTGYDVVDNQFFATGAQRAREQAEKLRRELGLPENYFLASARFVEMKNLPRLIEAYDNYQKNAGAAPWSLVILGDGELRAELERQIAERGLSSSVMMPGFKQYGELPNYYGLAGAFVHASTMEPWGLVVNEAMAAGLPVIVSERCGCAPELLESGANGFIVDPTDAGALAGAMNRIASNECDRPAMGERSREMIGRWTPETFANGLRQAVDVALTRPRAPAGLIDRAIIEALRCK